MSFQVLHADVLGERARLTPDKIALVDVVSGARLSYRDLDRRAAECGYLWRQQMGLRKGDRIGILSRNRLEFLDAFFAAGKSGVILVPLNTRHTVPELQYVINHSGMRALIYEEEFSSAVDKLKQLLRLDHWICADDRGSSGNIGPGSDLAHAGAPETCSPEDPYCILYTSGTTGRPKGVTIPHRMVAWNGYNTAACWQLRDDDVSPVFTPLYHAGGLAVFLVPLFTVGGTILLHARFDASEVWRVIEEERATLVFGVPTIFKLMMEAPEFASVDVGSVRWFISGGAPLPQYLIEAYQKRGIELKQGYGLTEVGVNCFSMTVEESRRKAGSIGKPMMFTSARLIDGAGLEIGPGEVGELLLRGPHVCSGYWSDAAATARALDKDGWFHTGDLARRDEEGFYTIAGRLKEMIISGGVNISPAEVEGELLKHPAVEDAAVTAVPHSTWGEQGVAFVVKRPGTFLDQGVLTRFLEARLARYKVPKEFLFVEFLPRTDYGKVVKKELLDHYVRQGKR